MSGGKTGQGRTGAQGDPADPGAKARPATLADIARAAGVHTTTASRALRGSDGVGRRTAERIREVAEQLGYLPHPAAASLRTGRSKLIGVVVPRLTDLVLATIYEGVEHGSNDCGYQTVVANSGDDRDTQRLRVETLLGARVDGLILGDARSDASLVRELVDRGTKVVLTSRRLTDVDVCSVTCDDTLGGRLAAEHLLELGHRELAVIAGEPYASTGAERTAGFVAACREAGIRIPESRVLHSRFDVQGGRQVAEELLTRTPRPTALFAVNDFAAIGAMGAVRDAGLRVGEDVAIVGFNDVPLAAQLPVALSTVHSPMRRMGYEAAHTLARLIDGQPCESLRLEPTFQPRASSLGGQ
ncbi:MULTISPECIES: LacI family DNA-binding transcriptional regulator [unclassified Streptomyces]|uniref:LacI family DNA-binding transcriptional regulator n=1 Tax=unclassified Streptomyces TaxID=2593676 RepID=UPI002DDA925C|nr:MULTISPECIES: LacI family DNA-binding transcriptional regulator [unclassified Streptomyces]WSA90706.1 LacI family transcriptional regulator [Streptomyces sp. NBC_01795]WSB75030.1 LacI family transcriptional regulator [Streptomyces sp. NBC_01775]WSS16690.1 LacI family transcriptional regulator [Streptomyces sp. NBC_01186]WSS45508.1 LacI family transcriptional regulator [Streptomyces sp. NBC_01187]